MKKGWNVLAAYMQIGLGQMKRKALCAPQSKCTLIILWLGHGFNNNLFPFLCMNLLMSDEKGSSAHPDIDIYPPYFSVWITIA